MSTWQDLKDNPRLRKIYETRVEILRLIREFFWSEGFVETDTPLAVRYPSQEPYLNFFPISVKHPSGSEHQMFLRTSPEFALKKLLAAGFPKIFEIGKCFRNVEDFGGTHNPEFTMIEWYRAPGGYADFMDDMERLYKFVAEKTGITTMKYNQREIKVDQSWDRLSMKAVWKKYVGAELDNLLEFNHLAKFATARGYAVNKDDQYDDIFFKIFLNEIEPYLGLERPLFVYDYPAIMTSLSRKCAADHRYAERVECYISGLEMCNGFGELTDADLQNKQLERDLALRAALGKETWPVDPDFIAALRSGMPPAGGVAMGVDRMVVLFTGANDINEVMLNSMSDQWEQ